MTVNMPSHSYDAALVLPTGEVFWGMGVGTKGTVFGEVCFNTAMSGYQEILTDPSYAGQIITFTFPHIGNVGCNDEDVETRGEGRGARGLILREPITEPSNYRSTHHLNGWLVARGITGISGIDTRALTRKIRAHGAVNVAIVSGQSSELKVQIEEAKKIVATIPSLAGAELAAAASCTEPEEWTQKRWSLEQGYTELCTLNSERFHIVAIDYGAKLNILRSFASLGCRITVVPAITTAEVILAMNPDGVFLSNGPGDPAATGQFAIAVIQEILKAKVPLFGICLGHQMLALALGANTEKMHQGHRGANHPIKNLSMGTVEITSQNHGFVVSEKNLPAAIEVTHRSLFDGTIAGIKATHAPAFAVQYHPESSPGPHDSRYLFEQFVTMIREDKDQAKGIKKHA
jgi:carbamoyl-phosphate synthase small subunit